jgi:hypothetical protein
LLFARLLILLPVPANAPLLHDECTTLEAYELVVNYQPFALEKRLNGNGHA